MLGASSHLLIVFSAKIIMMPTLLRKKLKDIVAQVGSKQAKNSIIGETPSLFVDSYLALISGKSSIKVTSSSSSNLKRQSDNSSYSINSTNFVINVSSSDYTNQELTIVGCVWYNNSFDTTADTVLSLQMFDQNSTTYSMNSSTVSFNITKSPNQTSTNSPTCSYYNPSTGWEACPIPPKYYGNGTYECQCTSQYSDYSLLFDFQNSNSKGIGGGTIQTWVIILIIVIVVVVIVAVAVILMVVPTIRNTIIPYNRTRTRKTFDKIKEKTSGTSIRSNM